MNKDMLDETEKQRARLAGIPVTGSERLGESIADYLRAKRPAPVLNLTVNEFLNAKMMQKR